MAAHAVSPLTGGLLRRGVAFHHRRRLLAVAAVAPEVPAPTPAPSQPPPSPAPPRKGYFPKRGETIELTCEALAFKGKGVCKVAGSTFVLLCDGALPGERLVARVRRLRRGAFAEAAKLKTLEPHHDAVEAPCPLAADCGGCKTQSLAYAAQIRHKHDQVRDLLVNFGKFDPRRMESSEPDAILKSIVPCDEIFRYRNKMEFSFGTKRWMQREWKEKEEEVVKEETNEADGYALGLHAPGFFDKVLHVEKCFLQSEPADKVLAVVQETWMDPALGLTPYDVHKHVGFLKHLMIRTGRNVSTGTPEVMVNFVTSCYKPVLLMPLVDNITKIPEVVSVINNVNTSVGNTSVGEQEYTLYGKPNITEMLRGLTFQISANSFFQTNTKQADVLYKLIEDSAGLKGDGSEIVLDLFCGTGTIGLTLARRAKHVYGYEVVPEAIADARKNAKLNGINNATFVEGDLNKINESFGKEFPKPDIIISGLHWFIYCYCSFAHKFNYLLTADNCFDPNRPGMHMKLIKWLLEVEAPRIVYVSCNPATCARDLDYLCHGVEEKDLRGCYELKSVIPVDMFPHTPHIECVCLLELH
ncbi:putative RNA methyltransferase CT0009 [Dichanthelium oligosanthes]|uniref:Putative RNA methyltransferase CT0009 n=1 Tax=Dichanthelium oligosanthes TaxID=888268 RepID=A0A1E5WH36_9POAL|nr:putative RNA methyltransferase CT0009 [Dichanthelium oligosanthes]